MSFYNSRSLKLLVAGLYFTVVLAAGLFHTHHHGDHIDSVSDTKTSHTCCESSCPCTHGTTANSGQNLVLPALRHSNSREKALSDEHDCPICSFLAQKPITSKTISLPTWTPLCGERVEVFKQPFILSVSFSWLSRAPPLRA